MIYAYLRCSRDIQETASQKVGVVAFAAKNELIIDEWVEEYISGAKNISDRKLGNILQPKLKKGDIIICSELSRLSRKLFNLFNFLQFCLENEITIYTVKEQYKLGNDLQSTVMAFAFGLAAQIERDMISSRTKEGLARKRAEGVVLGRPIGSKSEMTKAKGMKEKILKAYEDAGGNKTEVGRICGVHRTTITNLLKAEGIKEGCQNSYKCSTESWKPRELKFLKENFGKLPVVEISKKLNRSTIAIRSKANTLSLRGSKKYTDIINAEIADLNTQINIKRAAIC